MSTINTLGFIEVYGLVAGIEAADAMLKSAQVRLLRTHDVHPGLISLVVEGDLAACRAAIDAGAAAAARVGKVIATHVIGRPDGDTETIIMDMLGDSTSQANKAAVKPAKVPEPTAKPQPAPQPAQKAVSKTVKTVTAPSGARKRKPKAKE